MCAKEKIRGEPSNIHLAFDVGHSSIGWAVLEPRPDTIDINGCGAVTFRADDCLASTRRAYRRQRRHIRSTRTRIARLKLFFQSLGVLSLQQLDAPGCAWPWLLSARVLAGKSGQNPALLLTWPELWDVLRWYAHNRGYDGNRRWSSSQLDTVADKEDTEKVQNAEALMRKHGSQTMAATFCAVLGIDPLGSKKSSLEPFKNLNAAFPRDIVENEVRQVLERHFGSLPALTPQVVNTLLQDARLHQCPDIHLPKRYSGGLLFGQLVPRFDNRMISECPISALKVPSKNCVEFFRYRWAMQLANIQVGTAQDREMRFLKATERKEVHARMCERGYLTPFELKKVVRQVSCCTRDNLDTMLMHPDAKDALVLDPVQKLVTSDDLSSFWQRLPERLQKRWRGKLRKGKALTIAALRAQVSEAGLDTALFDRPLGSATQKKETAKKTSTKGLEPSNRSFVIRPITGRAPYSRQLLQKAFDEVLRGCPHPKSENGCLFLNEQVRQAQSNREITAQTNNHLVRHRLLLLEKLLADIIQQYAGGEQDRVTRITIEVNRDLKELSGKTAKEKAQDLGLRIANHHAVASKLQKAFEEQTIDSKPVHISAGLIRKARIAEDLGWTCPYTGKEYEPIHLVTRDVDKDHIVPRSLRPSDGLDSLAVTFKAVNAMKGKRTALQFILQEQGNPVPGLPNLSIMSLSHFRQFVEKLETYKGHEDDKRRKKKRKELLLLENYEQKEFVPRDLTQTSQLVRLGAQVLRRTFADSKNPPTVISLPGSVTGHVRKSWDVIGCLSAANPQILDENGLPRPKGEIRDITHLHHALDACVLGLAAHLIPNNGRVWELLLKRRLTEPERGELAQLRIGDFNQHGEFRMKDLDSRLKESLRQRLSEKRVVQHIPARMHGLRVEQNTWRVVSIKDGAAVIQQRMRAPDGSRPLKLAEEKVGKLLGIEPTGTSTKLRKLKGALVLPDNFGLALDPEPTVIPFHKVWPRMQELRERNGGKWPRIVRNGQLIRVPTGTYKGTWKVFSVKNNTSGLALDIGYPDVVRLKNKTEGHKINVLLASLLKQGMQGLKTPLTGTNSCPSISSA
jgi:hypothetical protein